LNAADPRPALPRRGLRCLALAAAAFLAQPATAQDTDSERIERRRVGPGETVTRSLECPARAQVTGGGYHLFGQPEDRMDFVVTGSYPLGDRRWQVEVMNISDATLPLTFRIYIICQ
jgi:hypothetical protein